MASFDIPSCPIASWDIASLDIASLDIASLDIASFDIASFDFIASLFIASWDIASFFIVSCAYATEPAHIRQAEIRAAASLFISISENGLRVCMARVLGFRRRRYIRPYRS